MLTLPSRHASSRRRQKSFGADHTSFLNRVSKTLCYGKYSKGDCNRLPVTELAAELFSRAKNKLSLDQLDVEEAAQLSRRASVSTCSLVLALIYLDRLKASNPKYLAKVPASQLFLISLMVGSKFMQDDGQEDEVNNCEWAVHAGLTVQDINQAEKEFLDAIQWEVFVSSKLFWQRLEAMERVIAYRQGCNRGWFSYTELDLLRNSTQLQAVLDSIFKMTIVCATSYAVSVFALLGSSMLVTQVSTGLLCLAATRPTLHVPTATLVQPLNENNTQLLEVSLVLPERLQSLETQEPHTDSLSCLIDRLVWNRNSTRGCQVIDDLKTVEERQNWRESWNHLWITETHSTKNSWGHVLQRYLIPDLVANRMLRVSF